MNSFDWLRTIFANDFLRFFDRSFQKNVKSRAFLKAEKNVKYVFSNTACDRWLYTTSPSAKISSSRRAFDSLRSTWRFFQSSWDPAVQLALVWSISNFHPTYINYSANQLYNSASSDRESRDALRRVHTMPTPGRVVCNVRCRWRRSFNLARRRSRECSADCMVYVYRVAQKVSHLSFLSC